MLMFLFRLLDDTKTTSLLLSQDDISKEEGMMQKIWVKLLNPLLFQVNTYYVSTYTQKIKFNIWTFYCYTTIHKRPLTYLLQEWN